VRRAALFAIACAAALGGGGCPRSGETTGAPGAPRGPTVRSFTESSAITSLAALPPFVLAGTTSGLDRFDLRSGTWTRIGRDDGLPGDEILAIAPVPDTSRHWVLTDGGLALYDLSTGDVAPMPAPDSPRRVLDGARAMAAEPDGSVWIGGAAGLHRVDALGWHAGGYARPVDALLRDRDGELWIGGPEGLVIRRRDGTFATPGPDEGFLLGAVRLILEAPDGRPFVVGQDRDGRPRVAFVVDERFSTFRPSPEVEVFAGARRGEDLVLATPGRLFALSLPRGGARVLRRDGMHLVPESGRQRRSPYEIRPLEVSAPPEATAIAAAAGDVLVGTRTLGVVRFPVAGERVRAAWLRRRDLVDGAAQLTVACAARDDCYLATGSARAWRYDGAGFRAFSPTPAGEPPVETLAVVRSPEGRVLAIHRGVHDRKLHFARLGKGGFTPVADLSIEVPGGLAALAFARFAPDGLLWLGLRVHDEDDDPRPFGVAIVDLGIQTVFYHRQEAGVDSRRSGILPIPNNATDVAFLGPEEIWLSTTSGAAVLRGDVVRVFSEAEGLESEILHGVVVTDGGIVFVASSRGVGEFDGRRWSWPAALALATRAIARAPDGRLWMATDRGLAAFDGQRVRRLETRSGLLDDDLSDLAIDHFGRVWVRSVQGVSLVTP
jgi:hypothetical protein